MRRCSKSLWIALVLLFTTLPAYGGDDGKAKDPSELTLTTTRAVVFKDGYALLVRHGRARADEHARVFTDQVPDAAVLGCFWAFAEGEQALGMEARLVTTKSERTQKDRCLSMLDLLRANRGNRITLQLTGGEELTGTIADVLLRSPREPAARPGSRGPYARGRPAPVPAGELELVPEGGGYVLVDDTSRGQRILPVSQVQGLAAQHLETTIERRFRRTSVHKRLGFQLPADRAGKDVEIQVLYFTPGLRWIPTYRVAGELKTDARLALQGEILNEVEDLDGVALDLVVGVPNFRFKKVVSPLVLEAALRNALVQAAPQLMGQTALSNAAFASRAGERRGPPVPTDLAPELKAEGTQDLYVYKVPRFSLPKGARCTVPLWQSTVPLQHLYTLDVSLGRDQRAGSGYVRAAGSNQRVGPLDLAKFDVWHQLELENRSQVPWTTGAALAVRGTLPIAQELLTYTPVGAKTLLPLTVAVDVRADVQEEEVAREPKAIVYNGYPYALVHKKTVLSVTNFRASPTTLRVRLALGGKAVSASDEGKIRINDYRAEDWSGGYDARLNHHSDVEWRLTLEPGETHALSCAYGFYLR